MRWIAGALVALGAWAGPAAGAGAQGTIVADPLPGAELSEGPIETDVVATPAYGGFVVAWTAPIGNGVRMRLYARALDEAGRPRSAPVVLGSSGPKGFAQHPRLAYDPVAGHVVAAWWSYRVDGRRRASIRTRVLDAGGRPLGPSRHVSGGDDADDAWPDIAYDARSRRYAVVWSGRLGTSARLLDHAGRPVGRVRRIGPNSRRVTIAADARRRSFMVAWTEDEPIEPIFTRTLLADGRTPRPRSRLVLGRAPRTRELAVESLDLVYDSRRGRFVIARAQDVLERGVEWSKILLRRLSPAGTSVGGDLELDYAPTDEHLSEMRMGYDRASDRVQAVWTHFRMGSSAACADSTITRRAVHAGTWRRTAPQSSLSGPTGRQYSSFCYNHASWPSLAPAGGGRWMFAWGSPPYVAGAVVEP
jgi:hypothetical protein